MRSRISRLLSTFLTLMLAGILPHPADATGEGDLAPADWPGWRGPGCLALEESWPQAVPALKIRMPRWLGGRAGRPPRGSLRTI